MVKSREQRSEPDWWLKVICPVAGLVRFVTDNKCDWAKCPGPKCMFFADGYEEGQGACSLAELVRKAGVALDMLNHANVIVKQPIANQVRDAVGIDPSISKLNRDIQAAKRHLRARRHEGEQAKG